MATDDVAVSAKVLALRQLDRVRLEALLLAAGARVGEGQTKSALVRTGSRLTAGRLLAEFSQHELERTHEELRPGTSRLLAAMDRVEIERRIFQQLLLTTLEPTKCQDCVGTGRCRRCELYMRTRAPRLLGARAVDAAPLIEGSLRQRNLTVQSWLAGPGLEIADTGLVQAVIDAVNSATGSCRDCSGDQASTFQCKHCVGTGQILIDSDGTGDEKPATVLVQHDEIPAALMPPGDLQVPIEFLARLQARLLLAHRHSAGLCGSEGVRADLSSAPHQASAVLEVLTSFRRRSVLADEVGMGKTIEALMVMKALDNEFRLTSARQADAGIGETNTRRCRTLIVVPEHLTFQWLCEIYLRCHEVFHVAEPEHLVAGRKLEHHGVIVSAESIRSSSASRANLLQEDWDMVIVDEAHKARGEVYDFLRQLSWGSRRRARVEHILLLTATPIEARLTTTEGEKRSQQTYENLLRLVEPDRFSDADDGDVYNGLVSLQEEIGRILSSNVPPHDRLEQLVALLPETGRLGELATRVQQRGSGADQLRAIQLAAWVALAGRAVHRTRRVDAPGLFRRRRPFFHMVPMVTEAAEIDLVRRSLRALADDPSIQGRARSVVLRMTNTFEWRLACSVVQAHSYLSGALAELRLALPAESGIDQLAGAIRGLGRVRGPEQDSKLRILQQLLRELVFCPEQQFEADPRRVVIFVEYLETLDYLKRYIPEALPGVEVSEFSSRFENKLAADGVPPPRLQQLLDFRGNTRKRILLSADVAAEGHNLHQSCHVLVLYDLDWNPNRTEQRIGRLDRIGQRRDIEIHVVAQEGTRAPLALDLQKRSGVFEGSLGYLAPDQSEDIDLDVADDDRTGPDSALPIELESVTRVMAGGARGAFHPLREITSDSEITVEPALDRIEFASCIPPGWVFTPPAEFSREFESGPEEEGKAIGAFNLSTGLRLLDVPMRRSADLDGSARDDFERHAPGVERAFVFLEPQARKSRRLGAAQAMAGAMRPATPWLRPRFGVFRRAWALAHDHLEFYGWGHPLVEETLLRSVDPRCGRLSFLRFRRPLSRSGTARGMLLLYTWDPARLVAGVTPFERTLQRVARAIWPTCAIPVLVGVSREGARPSADVDARSATGALAGALKLIGDLDERTCAHDVAPEEVQRPLLEWMRTGQPEGLDEVMKTWVKAAQEAVNAALPVLLTATKFGDRSRILDRAMAEVEEIQRAELDRARRDLDRSVRQFESASPDSPMLTALGGRVEKARQFVESVTERHRQERSRLDAIRQPTTEISPRLDQLAVFRVDLS